MLTTAIYRAAVVGRWTARIMGTLMALFFLAFVVGEGPPPLFRLSLHQNLHFFAIAALFVGLLLSWKWELPGGLIPLAGFVILVLIEGRSAASGLFLLPAAIAFLNLLCWRGLRAGAPAGGVTWQVWQVPRSALLLVGVCVGVFVALCANEIFGNPPLMTPSFHPPAAMVSVWRATPVPVLGEPASSALDVVFVINPDGSVAGRVGDAPIITGRMAYNRSWFGKLMNWREDYAIHGRLAHSVRASARVFGDQFTAPLMMRGPDLDGSLFLRGQPLRLRLTKQ
ncbi:MAG: hypothetical protein ABSC23_10230 [Bryobacteraceae bacterium]|jgi:hypothetical protein